MASILEPVTFDPFFRRELNDFEVLLNSRTNLREREDIIPFFKQRKHPFGDGESTFASLLIMGRATSLDDAAKRCMAWRSRKVLIDSNKVICITFDELYANLKEKFEFCAVAAVAESVSATSGLAPT